MFILQGYFLKLMKIRKGEEKGGTPLNFAAWKDPKVGEEVYRAGQKSGP